MVRTAMASHSTREVDREPQILHRKPLIPALLLVAVLASVALHIHATYELIHIGPAPEDMGMTPQRVNWVPTCIWTNLFARPNALRDANVVF